MDSQERIHVMNTKFDSDDDLPLDNILSLDNMTIVITSVILNYLQLSTLSTLSTIIYNIMLSTIYLGECLYEL